MGLNVRLDAIKTMDDVRDALQMIKESIDASVLEKGEWSFFSITVNSAVTNLAYAHNLKFIPKDVIELSVSNSKVVTWAYASFTRTNIVLSTTGACVIRAYIGRHREGSI